MTKAVESLIMDLEVFGETLNLFLYNSLTFSHFMNQLNKLQYIRLYAFSNKNTSTIYDIPQLQPPKNFKHCIKLHFVETNFEHHMSKVVGNSTYAKQQYLADCNKHLYVYLNNKVYSQIMNKLGLFLFEHILIMYKCTSSNIPNHFYDNGVQNNLLFSLTTCYLQLISIVTL